MSMIGRGKGVVPLLLAFILAGCGVEVESVGGPCNYERYPGIIEVISIEDGRYRYRFDLLPGQRIKGKAPDEWPSGMVFDIPIHELDHAVAGERFHADISVITEGSCVPFSFEVGDKV